MSFEAALAAELQAHPSAEARDIVKFCFQSAFGGAHLLKDPAVAREALLAEIASVPPRSLPLTSPLGGGLFRIELAAWRAMVLPGEWLFSLVLSSAERTEGSEQAFIARLEEATRLLSEGHYAITADALRREAAALRAFGIRPVSHSAAYREAEHPAYRILDSRSLRLIPILAAVAAIGRRDRPTVLRIDGRAASGKSSMAAELARILGCGVVHMDDFFLPKEMRTEARLSLPGGNVHHERFASEVLPHLADARGFSYRRFDCSLGRLEGLRTVAPGAIYLVEGSYSAHPALGAYADLTVFSDVDPKTQLARIAARNGTEMAEVFRTRWIPMEEAYLAAFKIAEGADLTV